MRGRRKLLCLLLAGMTLLLTACGNLFDREYLSVTDYEIPVQEPAKEAEAGVTVRNENELRRALVSLLNRQAAEGRIVFDPAYEGDISEDLSKVCWKVRTQDALFAYCVANISYDLTKLVNHSEARFTIRYTEAGQDRDSIVRLQLTNGLEDEILDALRKGDSRLVVLIGRSTLSEEDVAGLASQVYRENPRLEPKEPRVTVNMLSGTGNQRLYEINFNYGMTQEDLAQRRQLLQDTAPFGDPARLSRDPALRALQACSYLTGTCRYNENGPGDIYSALILGEANSEGLALAYVELCRQVNVPCQIVYGQRDWRSRCWNIIQLDGEFYHVDVAACIEQGYEQGFLLQDQAMWTFCRWDISSYPPCSGSLVYADLRPKPVFDPTGSRPEEIS